MSHWNSNPYLYVQFSIFTQFIWWKSLELRTCRWPTMLGKALIVFLALLTTSQLNDDIYLVVETCDGRTQFFPGERICIRLTGMAYDEDCSGDLLVYVYVYSHGHMVSIQGGKRLPNTKKVFDETITFYLPKETGEYVLRGAVKCSRTSSPSGDWEYRWVVSSDELRIIVRKCQETVIRKECSSDGKWVYAYVMKEDCEIEKKKIRSCSFGCRNGECLPARRCTGEKPDEYYQRGEYCYYNCEVVCNRGNWDLRNCKVEKKPCDEAKCTEDGWDTSECCDPSKKPKVLYYSDGNYCYYSCEPVCRNGNWFLENCSVSEKKCDTSKCTPTGWSECCERKPTGRRRCSESGGVEVEYLTEDCSTRWVKERDCLLGCSNGTCLESKKEVLLPPMLAILTILITTRRRRHLRRRVCKICGKQIMSGWRICPHCGSLLEGEKRTKERESDTKIYEDKKKEEK